MTRRAERVASLIKEEMSAIFLHRLHDPRLSMVTITSVKVSPDLKYAKLYLSVYDKEKRDEVIEKIYEIKGLIRSELAKRINLRVVPDLDFFIDDTMDYVEKMEGLFKKIHENDIERNEN